MQGCQGTLGILAFLEGIDDLLRGVRALAGAAGYWLAGSRLITCFGCFQGCRFRVRDGPGVGF